jgi:hypothetical protein
MRQLRYNIASALGAIVFVAVGFAVLREADPWWDRWLFSLTLGLLLVAVLLAAHRTGERRAFWIGFALFGWDYLCLSSIPSTEPRLITTKALASLHHAKIVPTRVYAMRILLNPDLMRAHNLSSEDIIRDLTPSTLDASAQRLTTKTWQSKEYEVTRISSYNKPEQYANIVLKANPDGEILRLKDVAKVEVGSSFFIPRVRVESAENFVHIGHSLVVLLAAWLGGVISRRLGMGRVSVAADE